jgi:bifunctional non-homologous end joining protein LigD
VISKRIERVYAPGDRGLWVKSKCLNREEFGVVGWRSEEAVVFCVRKVLRRH